MILVDAIYEKSLWIEKFTPKVLHMITHIEIVTIMTQCSVQGVLHLTREILFESGFDQRIRMSSTTLSSLISFMSQKSCVMKTTFSMLNSLFVYNLINSKPSMSMKSLDNSSPNNSNLEL